MKTVLDLIRQPLFIGALILSILIVGGAYFGSHWYYGNVEPIEIPEGSALAPYLPKNLSPSEVDLSGLQGRSSPPQRESASTPIIRAEGESVDDFLAELSDEEVALLTAEVVEEPQRVSTFGFGPYPQVPADYPEDVIWEEDMDGRIDVYGGGLAKAAELMDRVLIKLWNQGHRATSASMENGLVLPHYHNTVYVRWAYTEEPDGTMTRYAGGITSGPDVPRSVHDTISEEGVIPPGITVLDYDSNKIDPYTFLNLNQ